MLLMVLSSAGCQREILLSEETTNVVINASVLSSTAGLTVDISGPGIEPSLLFSLPAASNGQVNDTIEVPSGGGRRFVVTAIDTNGIATHRADTTVALQPGVLRSLALFLRSLRAPIALRITIDQ